MSYYRTRKPTKLSFNPEENQTKQSFRDEVNINNILDKYQATGQLTHVRQHPGVYGDFSNINDLQGAIEKVRQAQQLFESLPSEMRKTFNNNASEFIKFSSTASPSELMEAGLVVEGFEQSDTPASPQPAPTEEVAAETPVPEPS